MLVYNRFGSFNPFGMIFALTRDVVGLDPNGTEALNAQICDTLEAATAVPVDPSTLNAGSVRLRDCKRPRPLVLRANVGDVLVLRVRNLLRKTQPGLTEAFCNNGEWDSDGLRSAVRPSVSEGDAPLVSHGEALCETGTIAHDMKVADRAELDKLRRRGKPSTVYLIEVCRQCWWNHMRESFEVKGSEVAAS